MRLLNFLFVLHVTVAIACALDDSSGATKTGEKFAARIEGLLASAKETSYQHTTEIDERKGFARCDCSGLVGFVLRHDFPEAYISLKSNEAQWRKRPVSVTYYETFVAAPEKPGGPWKRVTKLMDAVPGDVMAWRKKTLKAGSTTGHTCVIAGHPDMQNDGTVRVRIIDSTRSPHANDTRPVGTTGVGAGYKTFIVNEHGEPKGYFVGNRRVTAQIAVGKMIEATFSTVDSQDSVFIGLRKDKAVELAETKKVSWRVIREDGNSQAVKWLIRDDRLNLVIENEKVVAVFRG